MDKKKLKNGIGSADHSSKNVCGNGEEKEQGMTFSGQDSHQRANRSLNFGTRKPSSREKLPSQGSQTKLLSNASSSKMNECQGKSSCEGIGNEPQGAEGCSNCGSKKMVEFMIPTDPEEQYEEDFTAVLSVNTGGQVHLEKYNEMACNVFIPSLTEDENGLLRVHGIEKKARNTWMHDIDIIGIIKIAAESASCEGSTGASDSRSSKSTKTLRSSSSDLLKKSDASSSVSVRPQDNLYTLEGNVQKQPNCTAVPTMPDVTFRKPRGNGSNNDSNKFDTIEYDNLRSGAEQQDSDIQGENTPLPQDIRSIVRNMDNAELVRQLYVTYKEIMASSSEEEVTNQASESKETVEVTNQANESKEKVKVTNQASESKETKVKISRKLKEEIQALKLGEIPLREIMNAETRIKLTERLSGAVNKEQMHSIVTVDGTNRRNLPVEKKFEEKDLSNQTEGVKNKESEFPEGCHFSEDDPFEKFTCLEASQKAGKIPHVKHSYAAFARRSKKAERENGQKSQSVKQDDNQMMNPVSECKNNGGISTDVQEKEKLSELSDVTQNELKEMQNELKESLDVGRTNDQVKEASVGGLPPEKDSANTCLACTEQIPAFKVVVTGDATTGEKSEQNSVGNSQGDQTAVTTAKSDQISNSNPAQVLKATADSTKYDLVSPEGTTETLLASSSPLHERRSEDEDGIGGLPGQRTSWMAMYTIAGMRIKESDRIVEQPHGETSDDALNDTERFENSFIYDTAFDNGNEWMGQYSLSCRLFSDAKQPTSHDENEKTETLAEVKASLGKEEKVTPPKTSMRKPIFRKAMTSGLEQSSCSPEQNTSGGMSTELSMQQMRPILSPARFCPKLPQEEKNKNKTSPGTEAEVKANILVEEEGENGANVWMSKYSLFPSTEVLSKKSNKEDAQDIFDLWDAKDGAPTLSHLKNSVLDNENTSHAVNQETQFAETQYTDLSGLWSDVPFESDFKGDLLQNPIQKETIADILSKAGFSASGILRKLDSGLDLMSVGTPMDNNLSVKPIFSASPSHNETEFYKASEFFNLNADDGSPLENSPHGRDSDPDFFPRNDMKQFVTVGTTNSAAFENIHCTNDLSLRERSFSDSTFPDKTVGSLRPCSNLKEGPVSESGSDEGSSLKVSPLKTGNEVAHEYVINLFDVKSDDSGRGKTVGEVNEGPVAASLANFDANLEAGLKALGKNWDGFLLDSGTAFMLGTDLCTEVDQTRQSYSLLPENKIFTKRPRSFCHISKEELKGYLPEDLSTPVEYSMPVKYPLGELFAPPKWDDTDLVPTDWYDFTLRPHLCELFGEERTSVIAPFHEDWDAELEQERLLKELQDSKEQNCNTKLTEWSCAPESPSNYDRNPVEDFIRNMRGLSEPHTMEMHIVDSMLSADRGENSMGNELGDCTEFTMHKKSLSKMRFPKDAKEKDDALKVSSSSGIELHKAVNLLNANNCQAKVFEIPLSLIVGDWNGKLTKITSSVLPTGIHQDQEFWQEHIVAKHIYDCNDYTLRKSPSAKNLTSDTVEKDVTVPASKSSSDLDLRKVVRLFNANNCQATAVLARPVTPEGILRESVAKTAVVSDLEDWDGELDVTTGMENLMLDNSVPCDNALPAPDLEDWDGELLALSKTSGSAGLKKPTSSDSILRESVAKTTVTDFEDLDGEITASKASGLERPISSEGILQEGVAKTTIASDFEDWDRKLDVWASRNAEDFEDWDGELLAASKATGSGVFKRPNSLDGIQQSVAKTTVTLDFEDWDGELTASKASGFNRPISSDGILRESVAKTTLAPDFEDWDGKLGITASRNTVGIALEKSIPHDDATVSPEIEDWDGEYARASRNTGYSALERPVSSHRVLRHSHAKIIVPPDFEDWDGELLGITSSTDTGSIVLDKTIPSDYSWQDSVAKTTVAPDFEDWDGELLDIGASAASTGSLQDQEYMFAQEQAVAGPECESPGYTLHKSPSKTPLPPDADDWDEERLAVKFGSQIDENWSQSKTPCTQDYDDWDGEWQAYRSDTEPDFYRSSVETPQGFDEDWDDELLALKSDEASEPDLYPSPSRHPNSEDWNDGAENLPPVRKVANCLDFNDCLSSDGNRSFENSCKLNNLTEGPKSTNANKTDSDNDSLKELNIWDGRLARAAESPFTQENCIGAPASYSNNTAACNFNMAIQTHITQPEYGHQKQKIVPDIEDAVEQLKKSSVLNGKELTLADMEETIQTRVKEKLEEEWTEENSRTVRIKEMDGTTIPVCIDMKTNRWARAARAFLERIERGHYTIIGKMIICDHPELQIRTSDIGDFGMFGIKYGENKALLVKQLAQPIGEKFSLSLELLPSNLQHKNVLPYTMLAEDHHGRFFFIATELCELNLLEYIHMLGDFDMATRRKLQSRTCKDIARGLRYLHSFGVIHGRLKPTNVLIRYDNTAVLCDYGLVESRNDILGYLAEGNFQSWRPTEYIEDYCFESGFRADIQVAGMLFFYIWTLGDHPFHHGECDVQTNIVNGWRSPRLLEVGLMHLVNSMLNTNPPERPTAAQVFDHIVFWNYDKKFHFLMMVFLELLCQSQPHHSDIFARIDNIHLPLPVSQNGLGTWHILIPRKMLEETSRITGVFYRPLLTHLLYFMYNLTIFLPYMSREFPAIVGRPHVFFMSRFPTLAENIYCVLRDSEVAYMNDCMLNVDMSQCPWNSPT